MAIVRMKIPDLKGRLDHDITSTVEQVFDTFPQYCHISGRVFAERSLRNK